MSTHSQGGGTPSSSSRGDDWDSSVPAAAVDDGRKLVRRCHVCVCVARFPLERKQSSLCRDVNRRHACHAEMWCSSYCCCGCAPKLEQLLLLPLLPSRRTLTVCRWYSCCVRGRHVFLSAEELVVTLLSGWTACAARRSHR